MKELLRIAGAVREMEGMEALRDYALEVFAGDILYIQGAPGSGVRTLVSLLAGECTLQAGRLYLDGTEISVLNRLAFWRHGLYTITAEKDLVEEMTVAENLEAVCYLPNCLKIYQHEASKRRVAAFLRWQKVDVPSGAFVWSLRRGDRAKLSLIKARMHGAKLIVLDATEDFYEGQEAQELCEIIRRENREGVTFVILSECYSAFAAIATRIQLVDRGRDMKEWPGLTPHIEEVLRGSTPRKRDKAQPDEGRPFLGIYDFAWERRGNFWAYLRQLRDENPEIWNSCLHFEIPEDGTSRRGDTVVIPEGSEDMLLRNLSLSDNLILPCAARVAANRFGRIPRHVKSSMDARFHRLFGLPDEVNRIDQLDRVARKILSIYRYELLRPSTIVLESPYAGMMNSEVLRMRRYLQGLADRGIRVLYFSRSPDTFMADCAAVIVAHNGREAKISTE